MLNLELNHITEKKYLSFSKNLVNYERKNSVCICINGDLIWGHIAQPY